MKKLFTLFAAAMLGLCAFAEEGCPSEVSFQVLDGSDPANVVIELMLLNSSNNLNGFNLEAEKSNANVAWKRVQGLNYFTGKGYAPVILGMLAENMGMEFSAEELEEMLGDMADIKSSLKPNDPVNGNLVMIELLSTNDCRFFPVLDNPTAVGKFKMDWSNVADGGRDEAANECTITVPAEPSRYSFAYTGGPEGTRAWTPDNDASIVLEKVDGIVRQKVETAISTISTDQAVDNRIFDLQGRELQSVPEHGIYIQNGKKYVK